MGKSNYNPERHHRQTIRLPKYNYAGSGAYMVTICVGQPRRPLFERQELRTILEEVWQALPHRFKGVQLDEFMIMPDHIHFIIRLDATLSQEKRLGDIVGAYKSLTTAAWLKHIKANELNEQGKFWQADYFEHIIRNEHQLTQCRVYIRNNPHKPPSP